MIQSCKFAGEVNERNTGCKVPHFKDYDMMNTARFLLVCTLLFGMVQGAEAQFLNRLKNRIIEETEKVVIDKAADKAADKTGEAMDKILSPDITISSIFGEIGTPVDVSNLPDSYRFDYLYSMKMATGGEELNFDYLLSESEPYLGIKPNIGGDISMIVDEKNKAIVTVSGEHVFAMAIPEDTEELEGEDPAALLDDYTVTQLPNRTFLGHDCVGYQMENNEHLMKVYVAPDMQPGLWNVFETKQANVPRQFESLAKYHENGLVMFMEMQDKSSGSSDAVTTMECIAFEKQSSVIRTR